MLERRYTCTPGTSAASLTVLKDHRWVRCFTRMEVRKPRCLSNKRFLLPGLVLLEGFPKASLAQNVLNHNENKIKVI